MGPATPSLAEARGPRLVLLDPQRGVVAEVEASVAAQYRYDGGSLTP